MTAKIANQATLLRRRGSVPPLVADLRALQRRAASAASVPELFGVEGDAAARYFSAFDTMLSAHVTQGQGLRFEGRNRRPARDPSTPHSTSRTGCSSAT